MYLHMHMWSLWQGCINTTKKIILCVCLYTKQSRLIIALLIFESLQWNWGQTLSTIFMDWPIYQSNNYFDIFEGSLDK